MPQAAKLALLAEECQALEAIKAEAIGWIRLGHDAYLHHGHDGEPAAGAVIEVVGIASAEMAGMNVLWLL
jgi:hypothetical protein